jgi:hypothetical protein
MKIPQIKPHFRVEIKLAKTTEMQWSLFYSTLAPYLSCSC